MDGDQALDLIRSAVAAERAGGYLVVGDLPGSCAEFVDGALAILFPDAADQLAAGSHPDVFRLEPQGKSRRIKVERGKDDDGPGMRDGLIEPMAVTAFSGGWKVGIIVGADRLQPEAANVLLKSLEEPTPKTLYFLLTDQPDVVLPTIISRCQRINLALSDGLLKGEDFARVAQIFNDGLGNVHYRKAAASRALAAILAELKDAAEDADVPLVRKAFFRTILSFVRAWMVENRLPKFQAYRNVEAVEEAFRQSERFLPDDMVLSFLMDRLVLPE